MSKFIDIRALGGTHFVRAQDVIAVQYNEPQKSTVLMSGGGTISCAEPAAQVKARVEAALTSENEVPHGDGSR